jgi:hypothetical protein
MWIKFEANNPATFPPDDSRVLIVCPRLADQHSMRRRTDGGDMAAVAMGRFDKELGHWTPEGCGGNMPWEVTHWQPLPGLPGQDEAGRESPATMAERILHRLSLTIDNGPDMAHWATPETVALLVSDLKSLCFAVGAGTTPTASREWELIGRIRLVEGKLMGAIADRPRDTPSYFTSRLAEVRTDLTKLSAELERPAPAVDRRGQPVTDRPRRPGAESTVSFPLRAWADEAPRHVTQAEAEAAGVVAASEMPGTRNAAPVAAPGFGDRTQQAIRAGAPADGYPAGWPRCPECGAPALDGHITCGRARCAEAARRHREAAERAPGSLDI